MAKLNVAIADDNERILTMLDEVLTADDDITVVGTARNGEQAYEMILDKKPDVVLLDGPQGYHQDRGQLRSA